MNPCGWPVHDQVDYLLLRFEIDDVYFEQYILREVETNPAYYIEPARMWSRDQRTSYFQMPLRNWRLWAVGTLKVFEKSMPLALKCSNPISRHHDAVNCGARHQPETGEYFDDTRRYVDRLGLNNDNRSERGFMVPNSGRRRPLSITRRFRAPIGRLARVYGTMRYRVMLHAE